MSYVIGWDIGGAHVKWSLLNSHGVIEKAEQIACPLWKGIDQLAQVLAEVTPQLPLAEHAVTMTGELVDCFNSREQGVVAILTTLQHYLPAQELYVYAGNKGFLPLVQVNDEWTMEIASANWLATAQWIAQQHANGVMLDIGSTTTDLLRIADGRVEAQGFTDYQRLVSGELLYTGVVRSAVMAVAQRAEFNGRTMNLMTEYFATMADVYRLTGDLDQQHDQSDTADGQAKTLEASARRLSRMTGYEFEPDDWPMWQAFAQYLKRCQRQLIADACLSLCGAAPKTIIAAGVGRFLARELASEWQSTYLDISQLFPAVNARVASSAADCAPAAAVACLWLQSQ